MTRKRDILNCKMNVKATEPVVLCHQNLIPSQYSIRALLDIECFGVYVGVYYILEEIDAEINIDI